jgi:hypothetical protein
MDKSLSLSEKLFCLAVNPKNGGILFCTSSALSITLAASVFIELINKNLISIKDGVIHLENPTPQLDAIHDFFMNRIRLRRKDRKLRNWLTYFNVRNRKVQKLFIRQLVRKNVLKTEERRILFIPYEKVFLLDRDLVENIRLDIELAALGNVVSNDDFLILAVLVNKTNLLSRVFPDRIRRKEAKRFLKNIPESPISKAVEEALQMLHAAVFVSAS